MARKVASNHYIAAPQPPSLLGGYWTDGGESQRTDRSNGYRDHFVHNERERVIPSRSSHYSRRGKSLEHLHKSSPDLRNTTRLPSSPELRSPSVQSRRSRSAHSRRPRERDEDSDIYVTSAAYQYAPSRLSRGSKRQGAPSEMSTRSKVSRKGGVVVETMSAPNPFCPNTKGCCCLLLLLNLGIILITLGFVIVMQFYEPVFVWVLGIVFLIFGFIALNVSLIYCVYVCKDAKTPKQVAEQDHYWTKHWQKNIGLPEIHYSGEKPVPVEHDRYSDAYSLGKHRPRY